MGDFNLTRDVTDKNNRVFNPSLATAFNNTIHSLALMELPLLDRLFTWTNNQNEPILARLDRVLLNTDFKFAFPNSTLTSQTQSTSDHVPLIISIATTVPRPSIFHFENSWLRNPAFLPAILLSWSSSASTTDTAGSLVARLKGIQYAAKVWARKHRSPPSIYHNCKFIILLLDLLEEQ